MKPKLKIPAADGSGRYRFLTDPRALRALIASLPLETRLRRLHDGAGGLTWADIDRTRRMSLLSLYRGAVDALRPETRRFLVGLSLPLPASASRMAQAYGRVYVALADGYKRVILEHASDPARDEKTLDDITRACYWAMYCLGERLRFAYESYHQVPEGLWREVHQVFRYARYCDVADIAVTADGNGGLRTPEHMYKRLLLLGLSDPYQLPFRTIPAVYHALDNWASRARLLDKGETASADRQFVVTVDLDRPALPGLPQARVEATSRQLVLDTTDLVDHLQNKRDGVIGDTLSEPGNEQVRFSRFEKMETLQTLIRRWCQHPLRVAPRTPTNRECELVVGLQSVYAVLNGKEPDRVSGALADNMTADTQNADDVSRSPANSRTPLQWTRSWSMADESAEGIRLTLRDPDCIQVRVGELVAFRSPSEPRWIIGEIRWAQTSGAGRLSVGVFKFGGKASAVTLKAIGVGDDTVHCGLLCEQKAADGRRFSLIADRDLYRPQMNYRISSPGHDRLLQASRVTISSRCFIWFKASPIKARPQDTMELILPHPMSLPG